MKYLFLLTIFSCAHQSGDMTQFKKIDGVDFSRPVRASYEVKKDYYQSIGDQATKALAQESMIGLTNSDRKDLLDENPINRIFYECHDQDFKDGFDQGDRLYQSHKNHPDYWNAIGQCYLNQNNFRKALLYFNKSLDIQNNYIPALNNLGVLYVRRGQEQKALLAFQQASKQSWRAVTPVMNITLLYLQFGLYANALSVAQSLVKRYPNDPDVKILMGIALVTNNRSNEALSYFENVKPRIISGDYWQAFMAQAFLESGDKKRASNALSEIGKITNSDFQNYINYLKQKTES